MEAAAAFVKPDPFFIAYPALGIIAICTELRRSRRKIGFADDSVKRGFAYKLIEFVLILLLHNPPERGRNNLVQQARIL